MELITNIIALAYDFDGTLTPQPMQEYTVLPKIGIEGKEFWPAVDKENMKTKGDIITTYMRLMLEYSQHKKFPITKEMLGSLAGNIEYFPGVEEYFARINNYVARISNDIEVRHYIISSGLKEIISETSISGCFKNIFASEYYYNEYNAATFPKIAVCDTLKTQFLFRINKGKEDINESINTYMPFSKRPIPFNNILYIGDGLTDVPCMSLTKKNRGYTIAVFQKTVPKTLSICQQLLKDYRVDFIAEADYNEDSELDKAIKATLDTIIEGIFFRSKKNLQFTKYLRKE